MRQKKAAERRVGVREKVFIGGYIAQPVRDAVKEAARVQDRSVSWMLEHYLRMSVERQARKGKGVA